jgi:hypothetical protein
MQCPVIKRYNRGLESFQYTYSSSKFFLVLGRLSVCDCVNCSFPARAGHVRRVLHAFFPSTRRAGRRFCRLGSILLLWSSATVNWQDHHHSLLDENHTVPHTYRSHVRLVSWFSPNDTRAISRSLYRVWVPGVRVV